MAQSHSPTANLGFWHAPVPARMSTGGPTRWSLSRSELARVSPARAGPHAAPPQVRRGCSGPEGSTGAVVEMKTASGLFRPGAAARAWIPYHRTHDDAKDGPRRHRG